MVGVEATAAAAQTELRDLMVLYQAGDRNGMDELVRRVSPAILRYFLASSVLRWEADDLLQECWIRVHRARHTYRSTEPVLPWVFAIARHTRLDAYRKSRRRQFREVLTANPPDFLVAPNRSEDPGPERFEQLLECLPDSQREVLVMLKVSGMSLEEVARATCSTVGSIKQKSHRAYQKLRAKIEKAGA
jgi:RNA polymerase sigma-70 factor (ECF subfamily)